MAPRKAATPAPTPAPEPEFLCGRFVLKSESQLKMLTDVMARNGLTVADIEARFTNTKKFPSMWGFKVLDALVQDEKDAADEAKAGKAPSEAQVDAVIYYMGKALASVPPRKKLAADLHALTEDITADRQTYSNALSVCQRIWPKEQDATAPEVNTAEGFGDEDFGSN